MLERPEKYNRTFLSRTEIDEQLRDVVGPVEVNRILAAYDLAENVHQFQKRNDGTPYIWHPTRVAKILINELHITDPDLLIGALLHDVLEDSGILTPEVLDYNFGPYVSYIVDTLTKEIGIKDTPMREKIDQEYIERLKTSTDDCRIIKLADRLDNVRCLEFNLKRNPIKYVKETSEHYMPMASSTGNPHFQHLLDEFQKERNRFFG